MSEKRKPYKFFNNINELLPDAERPHGFLIMDSPDKSRTIKNPA
jgi:hypothetical protein